MKTAGILSLAGLLLLSPPALAAGIDGTWDCRYAASTIAHLTIDGTSYSLATPDGQHGRGSFAIAPGGTAFTLDGYLADKLHVVGGNLTTTMMNNPELRFLIAGGDEIFCTGGRGFSIVDGHSYRRRGRHGALTPHVPQRGADERRSLREASAGEQGDQHPGREDINPADAVSSALAAVDYASLAIPPERRDWFVHFLEAGCIGECGGAALNERKYRLEHFQSSTVPYMLGFGVVRYFVALLDTVLSFDGDIDRGDVYGSRIELDHYSSDVLRDLFEEAVLSNNVEAWQRYPNWFCGTAGHDQVQRRFAKTRADAARYLPLFAPDNAVDLSLVDDRNPDVRRYTAMNAATYAPGGVNEQVVKELAVASQDDDWIWSAKDFASYRWSGKYSAAELLFQLRDPGPEALAPAWALLRHEKSHLSKLTGSQLEYVRQAASERIERLEKASSRLRRPETNR